MCGWARTKQVYKEGVVARPDHVYTFMKERGE